MILRHTHKLSHSIKLRNKTRKEKKKNTQPTKRWYGRILMHIKHFFRFLLIKDFPNNACILWPHLIIGAASCSGFSLIRSIVIDISLFQAMNIRALTLTGFLQGQDLNSEENIVTCLWFSTSSFLHTPWMKISKNFGEISCIDDRRQHQTSRRKFGELALDDH